MSTFGIQPINIIYENNYFTNGKIDFKKIKNMALKTALKPNVPVSFDMEFGNRFKPETVIPSKRIIPYFSSIVRLGPSNKAINGNLVEELSENEMTQRLTALYNLGASGCIIWASSQDRTRDGQIPQFYPDKGWGKAVVKFIKELE